MNRKVIFSLVGIFVIIGLVIISLLTIKSAPINLISNDPHLSNLSFVSTQTLKSGTMNYYNGRSFISLDTIKGKSTNLSGEVAFPNITAVHWSSTGTKALFRAIGYSSFDNLNPILLKASISNLDTHWWIADFTAKTYVPLSANTIIDTAWIPNSNDFYTLLNNQKLVHYHANQEDNSFNAPGISAFAPIDTTHLSAYQTSTNEHSIVYISGGTITTTIKNVPNPPIFAPDGKTVAAVTGGKVIANGEADLTTGNFNLYNTIDGKKIMSLGSGLTGAVSSWKTNQRFIFESSKNPQIITDIDLTVGTTTRYKAPKDLAEIKTIFNLNDTDLLISTINDKYLYLGTTTKSYPDPLSGLNTLKAKAVYTDSYSISYFSNSDTFVVSIFRSPAIDVKNAAMAYLSNHGVDPSLINISYTYKRGITEPGVAPIPSSPQQLQYDTD